MSDDSEFWQLILAFKTQTSLQEKVLMEYLKS
jgi:hypothetical protein